MTQGIETRRIPSEPQWIQGLDATGREEYEVVKAEDIAEHKDRVVRDIHELLGELSPEQAIGVDALAQRLAERIRLNMEGGIQAGIDLCQPQLRGYMRMAGRRLGSDF